MLYLIVIVNLNKVFSFCSAFLLRIFLCFAEKKCLMDFLAADRLFSNISFTAGKELNDYISLQGSIYGFSKEDCVPFVFVYVFVLTFV